MIIHVTTRQSFGCSLHALCNVDIRFNTKHHEAQNQSPSSPRPLVSQRQPCLPPRRGATCLSIVWPVSTFTPRGVPVPFRRRKTFKHFFRAANKSCGGAPSQAGDVVRWPVQAVEAYSERHNGGGSVWVMESVDAKSERLVTAD